MSQGLLYLIKIGVLFAAFVLAAWLASIISDSRKKRYEENCLRILELIQNKCSGEAYGLQILEASSGEFGQWAYPIFRRMERDGFLSSRETNEGIAQRGGNPRIYYSLTEKGKNLLASKPAA